MDSMRVLVDSIVDYAGLFPPAKLDMGEAVDRYSAYHAAAESWMLARFITPASRLDEFTERAARHWEREADAEPWFISALVGGGGGGAGGGGDLDAEIDRIFAFNQKYAPDFGPLDPESGAAGPGGGDDEPRVTGGAVIDTIELKVANGREIDRALHIIPEQLEPYFEIDWREDTRGMLSALAGTGARAKIRTGGVTPDQIPPAEAVAQFIANCAAADVPFKATAGLHHPIRAEYPLTYEPGCARGTMHGFINVFMAAVFVRAGGMSPMKAVALLSETDASAFQFGESHASWRGHEIEIARLAAVRERFAISFGSCSFEEPVEDLRMLNWL